MKFIIIIILNLQVSSFLSHTQWEQLVLEGYIVNSRNEPLPFSHVYISNSNLGTTSNELGYFCLNTPSNCHYSKLVVSHIGYKTDSFSIEKIIKNPRIMLQDSEVELGEIFVKGLSAIEIIRIVKDSINRNYISNDFKLSTFYRSLQYVDSSINEITEAIIEVYRRRYGLFSKNRISNKRFHSSYPVVIKGRCQKLRDFDWDPNIQFYGQISKTNFTDPIELASKNILGNENLNKYHFSIDSIIYYNNEPIWVISYCHLKDKGYFFSGNLYIRKKDFALIKISSYSERIDKPIKVIRTPLYKVEINRSFVEYTYAKHNEMWVVDLKSTQFDCSIYGNDSLNNVQIMEFFKVHRVDLPVSFDKDDFDSNVDKLTLHDYFKEYQPDFWQSHDYIPININLSNQ